jgi:hypothetical protein
VPTSGQTYLNIGQTYEAEYQAFVAGSGQVPAGSSHYGQIYTGAIDQGDDGDHGQFLSWMGATYPHAAVEVAISIKDNPAAGGYGTAPNAVYLACKDIAAGKWDAQIDSLAGMFKSYPGTIFRVRLDYEVSMGLMANATTTPWIDILNKYSAQGINILENPSQAPEIDLSAYIGAFNHMANRMRVIDGASNLQFVYHPVRDPGDCMNMYPGDSYVDWIGFSVFNNDVCLDTLNADGSVTPNCAGMTIDANLKTCIAWAQAKQKQLMVAESAFQVPSTGQTTSNFETYLDRLFTLVETYDFRGLTYIDSNWTAHAWTRPWGDSRIEQDPAVLTWWKARTSAARYVFY